MAFIPPDNRKVIAPNNPLFNQFPLPAVAAIDIQDSNTPTSRTKPRTRASGIVISPNHVLSAGHVGVTRFSGQQSFALRATTSTNENNLNFSFDTPFNFVTPGDPAPNIITRYYPANYPTSVSNASVEKQSNDDIALFQTSNTLLPESQVAGLIAFVNLRSAMGLTIETAGYPGDNVSSDIPNHSEQVYRDLVLSHQEMDRQVKLLISKVKDAFFTLQMLILLLVKVEVVFGIVLMAIHLVFSEFILRVSILFQVINQCIAVVGY
jgi:hypothetical protein